MVCWLKICQCLTWCVLYLKTAGPPQPDRASFNLSKYRRRSFWNPWKRSSWCGGWGIWGGSCKNCHFLLLIITNRAAFFNDRWQVSYVNTMKDWFLLRIHRQWTGTRSRATDPADFPTLLASHWSMRMRCSILASHWSIEAICIQKDKVRIVHTCVKLTPHQSWPFQIMPVLAY